MKVQLKHCKHGHAAPGEGINVRRHDRKADLIGLAASIRAHGLISPLVVVPDPGGNQKLWFVADGNRRLAALNLLVEEGVLESTHEVPVVLTSEESARELGLAANLMRAPLHPADQYQAFSDLAREGLAADEIAIRFGIPGKQVRQLLAIGNLSPRVLAAWRGDKLGEHALKLVQEFTLARDFVEQDEVLGKLTRGNLYQGDVKRLLNAGAHADGSKMRFVGRDAYVAAGGEVIEDLFGDSVRVVNLDLLDDLVATKIAAKCEELVADGWAWAASTDDLPREARWYWKQIEEHTPETKSKTGCILDLGWQGELTVREYVLRPEGADDSEAEDNVVPLQASPAPEKEKSALSATLTARLALQATRALQEAIPSSPKAGLAALLAGALCDRYPGAPVRVRLEGRPSGMEALNEKFDTLLAAHMDMSVEQLLDVAAQVAARALDLGTTSPAGDKGVMALAAVIETSAVRDALLRNFDAEAYFKGIPKALVLVAIEESLGADEARRVKSKPKGDLVDFALDSVVPTGWLPPEIRHPAYDGPGSQPAQLTAAA
jgi:ParB family chromosome partitioning protein